MSNLHNLFVSHRHEDDARIEDLRQLLSTKDVEIRDSSITTEKFNQATDEAYIKSGILGPRIDWAGTVVVIVTAETKNSPWVDWEIECAEKKGKRIVGVWAHGSADADLPDALKRHADAVVGWNADSIIAAIDGSDNWTNPDGSPATAKDIKRFGC
jgi:MTH538 TIR-like domain (DUF1863)